MVPVRTMLCYWSSLHAEDAYKLRPVRLGASHGDKFWRNSNGLKLVHATHACQCNLEEEITLNPCVVPNFFYMLPRSGVTVRVFRYGPRLHRNVPRRLTNIHQSQATTARATWCLKLVTSTTARFFMDWGRTITPSGLGRHEASYDSKPPRHFRAD